MLPEPLQIFDHRNDLNEVLVDPLSPLLQTTKLPNSVGYQHVDHLLFLVECN